ncbi:hypothetical protein I79_014835 [Cricetulus griseus]|uniref:Uncharacterized protein n=1 Tax=Cricetulus griseus TaxID=10029 RepID=G3HV58_CRIGR|nr:hypothetical protein I79_014835 [Cricetulus griseus]
MKSKAKAGGTFTSGSGEGIPTVTLSSQGMGEDWRKARVERPRERFRKGLRCAS